LKAKTYIDYKGGHGTCAAHVNRPVTKPSHKRYKTYGPGIEWWNDQKKKHPNWIGSLDDPT
jgi:hypothetical protein